MAAPIDLDQIRQRYTAYTFAHSQGGWRDAALQAGESADDVPALLAEVERLCGQIEGFARVANHLAEYGDPATANALKSLAEKMRTAVNQ